ncbi:hypothetical protein [Shouchella lehensis]|uniref:hypothetical protein n=1 Tax=Shouchella lehensis TaxID=300825 RepID=UPI00141A134D|nr:hypothetical protein [Shouchella lehensis]
MKNFLVSVGIVALTFFATTSLDQNAGPSDPVVGSSIESDLKRGPSDPVVGS